MECAMSQSTAEIVFLPVRERPGEPLRQAVWQLNRSQLLPAVGSLVRMATDAAEREDDAEFYERIRGAYLCLERVLVEQVGD